MSFLYDSMLVCSLSINVCGVSWVNTLRNDLSLVHSESREPFGDDIHMVCGKGVRNDCRGDV